MKNALARNALLVIALIVGAGLCGLCGKLVESPRGALGPSILLAQNVPLAVIGLLVAFCIATAMGVVVGRASNTAIGLFVFGGSMFGFAWRTGTVLELAHLGSPMPVVIETALMALLAAGAVMVIFRISGPLRDVHPDKEDRTPHPLTSPEAMRMAASALLVLPLVWFIAHNPAKGQAIGAAFVGGIGAGLAGRLLAPHVQPMILVPAGILAGAIGHLIAFKAPDLLAAQVSGDLPHLAIPMPIDYVAGISMGVAWGLGWAKSFLHHETDAPTTAAA